MSTLGMLLLGARGPSAGVLRELMQMDKFYTFNPHLVLKNVTAALQDLKDVHDVTFFCQFLVDMVRGRGFVFVFVKEMMAGVVKCAWKGGSERVILRGDRDEARIKGRKRVLICIRRGLSVFV